ncbi:MAG: M16 family metallopeptidase [Myxococcaceae bacterium]
MSRLWLAVCAAAGTALAQPPAPTALKAPEIPFTQYKLDNGLEVILSEDRRLPIVSVNVWYHVGAKNEVPGRSGFAHLFEHMMFQGSAHVADDVHISLLEQLGASDLNGTTHFDRTNYFETVPANHLETALWLESDRMGFLLDTLNAGKLETQKEVVKNERRQSVETRPYGIADERLTQALFPAPHPYFGNVIGSMADLNAASVADVQEFFRTYYAPANATVAIVGNFDPEQTKALVKKYFGSLPSKPKPVAPKLAPLKLDREVVLTVEDNVATLPALMVGWHTPRSFQPGDAALDLLAAILSDGDSSRLNRALVRDRKIAQSVQAQQQGLELQSAFQITAIAAPGATAAALKAEVDKVLEGIRTKGVTPREVERAKKKIETVRMASLQRVGGFGGKADTLQSYNHLLGTPDGIKQDIERFRAVTPQEVQNAVKTYLPANARVVVEVVPVAKVATREVVR